MESLQAVMQNEAWEPCPVGEGFSVLSLPVSTVSIGHGV